MSSNTFSNLIALDPIENALNFWGAGAVGKTAPSLFKQVTVVSPVIAQRNLSLVTLPGSPGLSRRGVAGAYLCYVDDVRQPSFLLLYSCYVYSRAHHGLHPRAGCHH